MKKILTMVLVVFFFSSFFSSCPLTCPPLVVEKILIVPPHCFRYQRNQRADTSWGSDVTFTLTNSVANLRTVLNRWEKEERVLHELLGTMIKACKCKIDIDRKTVLFPESKVLRLLKAVWKLLNPNCQINSVG